MSEFKSLLKTLIEFPATTGDTKNGNLVFDFVAQYLLKRGMHIKRYTSNGVPSLVATTIEDSKNPSLMLVAHLDVVPAAPEMFNLTEKNGKFFGRGVMDMKFAAATYLALVDELKNNLSEYDFGIMLTFDEEVGGANGTEMLIKKEGYRCNVAVIPDGAENWRIETFAKGVHWISLEADGKAAHPSRPWEGEDALQKLLNALHDIKKLSPNPGKKDSTITIVEIADGKSRHSVPAKASALLDVRYGHLKDYQEFLPSIEALGTIHGVKVIELVKASFTMNDLENPFIKKFTNVLAHHTGVVAEAAYGYGASDGRFFTEVGIPSIICEPPAGERHKPGEWISVKGCEQFYAIVKQYLKEVAKI